MKDRQVQHSGTQPGVPVVSPVLHWLAMPAIVFLRSGFGYAFLSPKSVFLAFAWASFLFLAFAWNEPWAWRSFWAVALFFATASFLYIIHLVAAFRRETKRKGRHDYDAGTSHLLRVAGFRENRGNAAFENVLHLWIEPTIVVVLAVALRGFMAETRLSYWLLAVAAGMWCKEFINYWYGIRSEKKHSDIIEDAEEKMPGTATSEPPVPNAGGRKPKGKYAPNVTPLDTLQSKELRYAEILRLMPPYDLEQAERNYRELIKAFHPNASSGETTEKSAALNEAIAYFRRTLSG